MRVIRRMIFHHSASPVATTMEEIRGWHLARGFSEIGYHFVIERHGRIRRGRPIEQIGAHALGANRDSVGVCITGDNTTDDERWQPDQIAAGQHLANAVWLLWPEAEIAGHRDVKATLCPGVEIRDLILRS